MVDYQHYNTDLHLILSSLEVTDSTAEWTNGRLSLALTVEPDQVHLRSALDEKAKYLRTALDGEVPADRLVDELVADINNGLDIAFNTIGAPRPDDGLYKKINEDQWQQTSSTVQYSQYSDLLWEVTGEEADPDTVSIPGLFQPFLQAVSESDDHDFPPQGTIRPILSTHIDEVRAQNKAREATRQLKAELESRGVDPRTASRVAHSMEESELLRTDPALDDE